MLTEEHCARFDRFDILESYYLALNHCHNGQFSKSYERLCRLQKVFRPSPLLNVESLTENGLAIYTKACKVILRSEGYVD